MSNNRMTQVLHHLEFNLAADFSEQVTAQLRKLPDAEINRLFLETHTDWNEGKDTHRWRAVLLPLVEHELDLRRDIQSSPSLGPALAPELYRKGGPHDLPF